MISGGLNQEGVYKLKVNVDKYNTIDLEKCPHILIGGSTGSGKSYLMKNMLCDVLKSGEAKVMVLDPKSVDYKFLENSRKLEWDSEGNESTDVKDKWLYRGIWLGDRDSIDSFQALDELKLLVKEMYKRYSYMKQFGYIDWQEVMNEWNQSELGAILDNEEQEGRRPFGNKRIVLFVDELADLIYWDREKTKEKLVGWETDREAEGLEVQLGVYEMMEQSEWKMLRGNVEGCLVKLSILGRAAGIHLVLGTQRPDAQVLSGQLRANLPCRICLRVSNNMERRIILGMSGEGHEREMVYQSKYTPLVRELR